MTNKEKDERIEELEDWKMRFNWNLHGEVESWGDWETAYPIDAAELEELKRLTNRNNGSILHT